MVIGALFGGRFPSSGQRDPHGEVLVLQERDVDPGPGRDHAGRVLHLRDVLAGHLHGEVV